MDEQANESPASSQTAIEVPGVAAVLNGSVYNTAEATLLGVDMGDAGWPRTYYFLATDGVYFSVDVDSEEFRRIAIQVIDAEAVRGTLRRDSGFMSDALAQELQAFFAECCLFRPNARVGVRRLHQVWRDWRRERAGSDGGLHDHFTEELEDFGQLLRGLGFATVHRGTANVWLGLGLKEIEEGEGPVILG